ncbi:hypothetical protein [Luteimonas terricola]|uniref:Uncharacterized protein n=1 Tax=Luteimonas terricola TaxID=645597 RepID=A0ABQ2EIK0_9GAMM|nr:hypothetical protein [Luteimonas terricola]GGK09655.1 hypothetical protein GCM10011394_18860 [Luteimonas terricola]
MVADRPETGPGFNAGPAPAAPDAAQSLRILALLRADDIDAAIGAGLAGFVALPGLDDTTNDLLVAARDRLLAAWAARDRYRARAKRLERIAEERRRARSLPPAPAAADDGLAAGTTAPAIPHRPSLPPAAAAALARARARTSGPRS